MPKAKAIASLSGMMDEEEDQDMDVLGSDDSNQENQEPVKATKGRGKGTVSRKRKPAAKRLSGGKTKTTTKKTTKRAPLKAQVNEQDPEETEEVDEFEAHVAQEAIEEPTPKPAPKRKGRPKKAKEAPQEVAIPQVPESTVKDGEFEYTPTEARRKGRAKKASAQQPQESADDTIPETQPDAMDVDEALDLLISDNEEQQPIPQSTYHQSSHARVRSSSRQPAPTHSTNHMKPRTGSTSSVDGAGKNSDPALRRRLGEMTKKFEALEVRYRNLRDIGVKEAEVNFDQLKKQTDERARIANDLIASLRKELASQKAAGERAATLQRELESKSAEVKAANANAATLTKQLAEAQAEKQALQAKLAASRSASANVESVSGCGRTPGSAIKNKASAATGGPGRTIMVGSAEAAVAAQVAQLKEDMYSDLTGLIVRGVERNTEEQTDVFDCLQTGRNGTLHFKLSISNEPGQNYDDAEFAYMPLLDANRDRALIAIMPEYLGDDITFSRPHAARFYSRVVDTLTRKFDEE